MCEVKGNFVIPLATQKIIPQIQDSIVGHKALAEKVTLTLSYKAINILLLPSVNQVRA